jgi:threonine/homoserine/homoserine lactone efflux protein
MYRLLAVCGLLCVAAITPGPNNLVVLRASSQGGFRAALPAIAGILLGGLLLLAVMALGTGPLFMARPGWRRGIGATGALYLVWLGVGLLRAGLAARQGQTTIDGPSLPAGVPGLIGFQFLNPKSWVMVLAVLAALPADDLHGYVTLAAMFILIPTPCLLLWAALGAVLSRWLSRPSIRRGIDVAMGTLLVGCACLLLIEN